MRYIIDANNLAGRLGLLGVKDYDRRLIGLLLHFFGKRNHQVDLVFDGTDHFGDKERVNNINVIRAPYSARGNSADDKIVDILRYVGKREFSSIIVVTDDLGLLDRVKIVEIEKMADLRKISSREFALKVQGKFDRDNAWTDDEDDKEITPGAEKKINDELLDLWVK